MKPTISPKGEKYRGRRVLVEELNALIVILPDSPEDRLNTIAGSSAEAKKSFSFSAGQASFLADLQADFLRQL